MLSPAPCVQVCDPCWPQWALLWAMALIEGVGDEVTLLFGSLLLLLVLLLAWISTRTAEPPEHLFSSTTGPAPSQRSSPTHQDTPPSNTTSSFPSSSVSDSSLTEAPSTNGSTREEKEGVGERREGGEGDGVRSRGGGAGAGGGGGGRGEGEGEGEGEPSSSQRNMVLRLKFLNDTERTAQVQPQDTIGYIKRYCTQTHTDTHRTTLLSLSGCEQWLWFWRLTSPLFQDILCRSGAAGPFDLSGSAAAGRCSDLGLSEPGP